jgi:hypothetical protein
MSKDQSLRVLPLLAQKEQGNLQRRGWPIRRKKGRKVQSSFFPFQTRYCEFPLTKLSKLYRRCGFPSRARHGFDLAADFLYRIVIPIDLMTFQTRDIRNSSRSWLSFHLATLSMPFALIGLCRYRQASFCVAKIVV